MTVVVPDGALADLESRLDADLLAAVLQEPQPQGGDVELELPPWTYRAPSRLELVLSGMGMPTAFAPGAADFSGMAPGPDLVIDSVLHEVFVAVDEEGTEAAAATAVEVSRISSRPPTSVRVVADRPFLFVVHDLAHHVPLFLGRVGDPAVPTP